MGQGRDRRIRQEQYVCVPHSLSSHVHFASTALALAMSRDGSSGGVIRMCVITEDGVERLFVPGDKLPTFWQGKEVLSAPSNKTLENAPTPMAVE